MFREAKIWQHLSIQLRVINICQGLGTNGIYKDKTKSLLPRNHRVVDVVGDRTVIRWLKNNRVINSVAQAMNKLL